MTTDKNQTESALTGFGTRLKAARESMRLAEKDVALRLHLNNQIITLIENEDYENGPPMIFLRGYLRSYARLVNLPEDEINLVLGKLDSNKLTSTVSQQRSRSNRTGSRFTRWMTYLIILVLIGLVAMWWNTHSANNNVDRPVIQPMQQTPATVTTAPIQSQPSTAAPAPTNPPTTAPVKTDTTNKQLNAPAVTAPEGKASTPTTTAQTPAIAAKLPTGPINIDAHAATATNASTPTVTLTPVTPTTAAKTDDTTASDDAEDGDNADETTASTTSSPVAAPQADDQANATTHDKPLTESKPKAHPPKLDMQLSEPGLDPDSSDDAAAQNGLDQ